MKIVILDGYTENPGDLSWSGFEEVGETLVYDRTDASETLARIGDADVVYTNKVKIGKDIIDRCPNLKFIGILATGYNVVDLKAARQRNIPVSNIPTYGTDAVGQFAIGLLLEICSRIGHHDRAVHEGRWANNADFCFWDYPLIELAHKTMGIIGYGRIGQATGRIAMALGMKLLVNDAMKNPALENEQCRYADLADIFSCSDVIALHCSLTPETEGIINKRSITQMKDGVILLNNSRGPLIVEQDLADALNSGKVYAAGLDVVNTEPILRDNPLLKAKNCIITPHISWAPRESRQRLMDIAVENLRAFVRGVPINVVN